MGALMSVSNKNQANTSFPTPKLPTKIHEPPLDKLCLPTPHARDDPPPRLHPALPGVYALANRKRRFHHVAYTRNLQKNHSMYMLLN